MSELNIKQWTVLCHISSLAGYIVPLGNILAPYLIWYFKKAESAEIDAHGKESVNFQISVTIYGFIALILVIVLIGAPILIALGIFQLVLVIIATIKADSGQLYRYPLTIRLIK